ncbi:uncharacterized protein BDR25DRAFT_27131 [Lindgomyces ingoldianus]|uniref:Uncharacterized protein n=1 Tax=Lindgomyces ingoldianus TaxID=673940 RepID=A0ACB6QX07_9PLEO|nr:uncharacterized protein BDR25DRAFT_27131 [Lindgomyces ingoldianus]KAF2471416.1 hypothetical protein BDR25DRAFT_27131 [Lindgomyces ingoldianus]
MMCETTLTSRTSLICLGCCRRLLSPKSHLGNSCFCAHCVPQGLSTRVSSFLC